MSASGVKLFDDDLANDVRDLFEELLKSGASKRSATKLVIEQFDEVCGTDEESVFWIAMAYVQWQHGCLQKQILRNALRVIDDESDLRRWAHDHNLKLQREKVLERLRHQLTSPQDNPKVVRTRKRKPPQFEWQPGDIFSYQIKPGQMLLIRTIAVFDNVGQDVPVCELLDWFGAEVPSPDVIAKLPIRYNIRYRSESKFYFPPFKKHLAKCRTLGIRTPPVLRYDGGYTVPLDFNKLTVGLEEHFGMTFDRETKGI